MLRFAATCALISCMFSPAAAQWVITAEATTTRFSGVSAEITPSADDLAFRPHRPMFYGIRIERGGRTVRVALSFHLASPGLALEGTGGSSVVKSQMTVLGAAPELSLRLVGGNSDALRIQAGPLIESWEVRAFSRRTRVGVHASMSYEFELTGRFGSAVRAGLARIESPFEEGDLPSEFERRAAWRRSVAFGLRYRL